MPVAENWPFEWCILLSFGLAVGLTAVLRRVAPLLGLVDIPGGRKHHARPTPVLGGVAVAAATMGGYALMGPLDARTLWLMGGALVVLALGVWDDRVGLRARFRLAIQLLAAGGIMATGTTFQWFGWAPLNWVVSAFWLVGLINAVNCLDCADGVGPGVAAIAAVAFFVIAIAYGHFAVALMAIALLGACFGFLVFNFPPASIFLGDAGSTFLGFMLGALAIAGSRTAPPIHQAWVAALPVGLAVWDIILVHSRRYMAGSRGVRALLESVGHDHLPHRLQQVGLAPRQVAVAAYLMAALFALPAVIVALYGVGALVLAMEIAFVGVISGEKPFGVLVGRLSRVARPARSARRVTTEQAEAGGAPTREAAGLSAAVGRGESLGGGG